MAIPTPAEQTSFPHAACLCLREAVMHLAVAGISTGRLVLFGDYGLGDDYAKVRELDAAIHDVMNRLGDFEQEFLAKVKKPGKRFP